MLRFVLTRLGRSVLTLFIVTTTVFMLLRLMPIEGYFSETFDKLTDEQIEASLREMGLLDPLPVQLIHFYRNIFKGDLGKSIVVRKNASVTTVIKPKIPYSVGFGLASIGISLAVGIPLGMLMVRFKGKFWDKMGSGYVVIIKAVPAAVYFLFLQIYITSLLRIPMLFNERQPVSWILPAICMSLSSIGTYAMWVRRYMVDEMTKDYIKLARAKGLSNKEILKSHVIRNAFVPLAQMLPANILLTISGSIFVEALFSIPGMGGLLISAIQRQDNTIVQALVLIYSSVGILGLFLGDLLMAVFDPRIRLVRKAAAR
ncbi:MAG: ABC transporter permease [Treponema sp.]|jgi:oligopeptide transport system permease protein|nr:ABC transporter permease [Treponema sp.]